MCGIVGFVGSRSAAPILLEGLSKLEYRGYDSAGIAVRRGDEKAQVVKSKGKLFNLIQKTDNGKGLHGFCGIGHTRWATHGEPSENNAHPHMSDDGAILAVHNGIIENYKEIKEHLSQEGYSFYSETDTEAAVKLLDFIYKRSGDPILSIAEMMKEIRGSYALAVMFREYPDEIFAARKDSPLIIGVSENENFIASDVPAILGHTKKVYYVGNLEIARVQKEDVRFFDMDGRKVIKDITEISWNTEAAEKGGFDHFMMKEIHEQPKAVRDTVRALIKNGEVDLSEIGFSMEELQGFRRIQIVACGSAYHVGAAAQYVFEDLAKIPVRIEYASEFRYRNPILSKDDLVIIISQSGETADSLSALREAKNRGVHTLAIVNVVGSSIAREAEHVLYTLAGPEIAVATTKAYSAQIAACDLLALAFAKARETISAETYALLLREMMALPEKIEKILSEKEKIARLASEFADAKDAFFVGRGIDYAISMEGSLKMKEISYIHSEAYAAGELKHGTISLIEKGTLAIGILTQPRLYEKTISNMIEMKSRGAYLAVMAMGDAGKEHADFFFALPETEPCFAVSLAVVPLQLLGYYLSVERGLDVDKPRNLAKSVTVE